MGTGSELDLEYVAAGVSAEVLELEGRSHLDYFHPLHSLDLILPLQLHVVNEMLDCGDKWIMGAAVDMG